MVHGGHKARRTGSVEGEKLCVQGLREKADKIKWVKKQKLIGATAKSVREALKDGNQTD